LKLEPIYETYVWFGDENLQTHINQKACFQFWCLGKRGLTGISKFQSPVQIFLLMFLSCFLRNFIF